MLNIKEVLAKVAQSSHDPNTQTACALLWLDRVYGDYVQYESANRLPKGVELRAERIVSPAKYKYVQHAEQLVIAKAARHGHPLEGYTLAVNWFPCSSCAGSIIESGIRKVIVYKDAYLAREHDPLYGFVEAREMLEEAGVEIEWI